MKKFLSLLAVCAVLALAVGCGGGAQLDGLKKSGGKITLDGQPLAGASITLVPTTLQQRGAGAMSDEKGNFVFQTLNASDGVAPGEYKLTVSKTHYDNPFTPEEEKIINESGGLRPEKIPEISGREGGLPELVNDIPEYYNNAEESGLTVSIPEGGKKDIVLELTSAE